MHRFDIASFGDSFIYGSEILNNHDGSMGWPGLAAKNLNCSYKTFAVPGCGNDHIARQIYSYYSNTNNANTLAVINWTWLHRWDFYMVAHEKWITLGETCVPEKLMQDINETEAHRVVDFYNDYTNSSLVWNKFRNLQTIYAVQNFLKNQDIISIQTCMDYHLLDQSMHAPDYIKVLQAQVSKEILWFDDKNFLDWSYRHRYEVTSAGLHPLADAHKNAAAMWQPIYKLKLKEIND